MLPHHGVPTGENGLTCPVVEAATAGRALCTVAGSTCGFVVQSALERHGRARRRVASRSGFLLRIVERGMGVLRRAEPRRYGLRLRRSAGSL